MLPAPGVMLTENLRLLRLLGRGGMGSVWLAEHASLGSEVAVKLLSQELASDPEALERFNREATALAALKTPHVVQIHDFGSAEGTPFFVMERLEGEDLSHRLDRVPRLPIGTVTAIVAQTCKALAKVHELGVVHRDLKPGNIFLTDVEGDLVVKLVDFGIAKRRDAEALHATSDSAILGTPLYMSPEQVFSTRDVTFASDLYSLGVVAYECLAGEPPFGGETAGAIHVAIAKGGYVEISSIDPRLPKTLDAWFAKALAQAPEQRFASARDMADEFMIAARGVVPAMAAMAQAVEARQSHSGSAVVLPPVQPRSSGVPIGAIAAVLGTLCAIALTLGIVLGAKDAKKPKVASPAVSATELAPASASASPSAPASASASASATASASASASAPASATASASASASAPASATASAATVPVSVPSPAALPQAPVPTFAPSPPSTLGAPPPPKARKNRGF